jgi:hypothetical protein
MEASGAIHVCVKGLKGFLVIQQEANITCFARSELVAEFTSCVLMCGAFQEEVSYRLLLLPIGRKCWLIVSLKVAETYDYGNWNMQRLGATNKESFEHECSH